jgi:hypothetical protein
VAAGVSCELALGSPGGGIYATLIRAQESGLRKWDYLALGTVLGVWLWLIELALVCLTSIWRNVMSHIPLLYIIVHPEKLFL